MLKGPISVSAEKRKLEPATPVGAPQGCGDRSDEQDATSRRLRLPTRIAGDKLTQGRRFLPTFFCWRKKVGRRKAKLIAP